MRCYSNVAIVGFKIVSFFGTPHGLHGTLPLIQHIHTKSTREDAKELLNLYNTTIIGCGQFSCEKSENLTMSSVAA